MACQAVYSVSGFEKSGEVKSLRRKLADRVLSEAAQQDSVEAQMDDRKNPRPETTMCVETVLFGQAPCYGQLRALEGFQRSSVYVR